MIRRQWPLILSSDPAAGAININDLGSAFTAKFDSDPLIIDKRATNCVLYVNDAEVTYTFPNVREDINNKLTLIYNDGINPVIQYDLAIPKGLYSLQELSDEIQVQLFNFAGYPFSSALIELLANEATQKVQIKYNFDYITIDFTAADSLAPLLGFEYTTYTGAANSYAIAPNVAELNTTKYLIVACDLVDEGLRLNNTYDSYIARILIDADPGSQILFRPQIKTNITSLNLVGNQVTSTRVRLLDQNGDEVDTNGETFSVNVVIEADIPVSRKLS